MARDAGNVRVWCMNYHDTPIVNHREVYRWHIDKNLVLPDILNRVPRGSLSRESWPQGLSVEAYSKGPLEDFPLTGANRPVVSERVRAEFERAFPGLANYFEFEIKWRKKMSISERYFVCEWSALPVDCIDMQRSRVIWIMNGTEPIVHHPVLDSGRLPSDRVVSYVEHILWNSIAWEPMRHLCVSKGFSGVRFEELSVV